jgi:hypothetical protein
MAAKTDQFRHVMSQTFCQRSDFPVSLSWLRAGGDLSHHSHVDQCADRPLLHSENLPGSRCRFPTLFARSHFARVASASLNQSEPA